MESQAGDVPVFVIAGSWEFSEKGIWDFYIAKEVYARSISMRPDMSYEELLLRVRGEFELDGLGLKPKLSYWLPCQLSVFAVNSRPPVIITSNMSLRNFLSVKETAVHLNLLLSLEAEPLEDVGTRLRQLCPVPAAKATNIGGNNTSAAVDALLPTSPGLPQTTTSDQNRFGGVRRRLFVDNEASGSNVAIRFYSVQSTYGSSCFTNNQVTEAVPDHVSAPEQYAMIRLGDDRTPSLSHHSQDSDTDGPQFIQHIPSDVDEDFIREVEAAEHRENKRRRQLKGKGICKESQDKPMAKDNTDDSNTDGLCWSGSDVEISDDDIWTLAFDRQYSCDESPRFLGMPHQEGRTPAAANDSPLLDHGEEDIGTSVLAYMESARKRRDAADAIIEGSEGNGKEYGSFASPDVEDGVQSGGSGFEDFGTLIGVGFTGLSAAGVGNKDDGPSSLGFPAFTSQNHQPGESSSGLNDATLEATTPGNQFTAATPDAAQDFSDFEAAVTGLQTGSPAVAAPSQFPVQTPSVSDAGYTEAVSLGEFGHDYTQRRDAEPVIDDVFEITNIDGCATVSAEEDAIYIGRQFKDKDDLRNTLAIYAIKRLFHFRIDKSDLKRFICVCIDNRCRWRVFAHRVSEFSDNFEIRTATLTHTCSILARSQYEKQASAKVIAEVLKGKYANGLPGPRAVDIPDIVLAELKVSVTYMKAWYAKEAAIMKSRGSDEKSYKLLAVYMYLLQKGNPGTIYKLEYTGGGLVPKQFKYLFFSLGASIAGIQYMRKVILVDGTAIKTKFKGVLMAASMQDANFQVYPIGFAIVDAENDLAWTWFFTQLSQLIPDAEDVVIVSDRHRSIYAGIRNVYPLAFHGACAVHIERNVRAKSPGTGISALVGQAARAFNVGDFKEWYNEIVKRSKKCAAYLDAIPLEHWTQAYCQAKRYNIMSSNIAEALNGAIAKIVELPIVSIVESIRTKLMEWFCFRREKGKKLSHLGEVITPKVNDLLLRHHKASAGLPVKAVSDWSYQVGSGVKQYYVDLAMKTCTCLQFQKLEIPCCHALAAARKKEVMVTTLVGNHYTVRQFCGAYEMFIYPVPNESDEVIPPTVQETEFLPPENKNGPGRRRKRRIPSTGEYTGHKSRNRGPHKCSTCGETGHNRATCSNMPR